jgi:hypothetical protein
MTKQAIKCTAWKAVERNTLRGFASIYIPAVRLTIHDVSVHKKGESRWAQCPSKPQLDKNHNTIRDNITRKPKYSPILEWDNAKVREAFSEAVCRAVEEYDHNAFCLTEPAEL